MIPVVIESPFSGNTRRNSNYLDKCIADSLQRGENPYASHRMLPQVLDDEVPEERAAGIACSIEMGRELRRVVFYVDFGISPGMLAALEAHIAENQEDRPEISISIEFRRIFETEED